MFQYVVAWVNALFFTNFVSSPLVYYWRVTEAAKLFLRRSASSQGYYFTFIRPLNGTFLSQQTWSKMVRSNISVHEKDARTKMFLLITS